jgi:hypothetical protein
MAASSRPRTRPLSCAGCGGTGYPSACGALGKNELRGRIPQPVQLCLLPNRDNYHSPPLMCTGLGQAHFVPKASVNAPKPAPTASFLFFVDPSASFEFCDHIAPASNLFSVGYRTMWRSTNWEQRADRECFKNSCLLVVGRGFTGLRESSATKANHPDAPGATAAESGGGLSKTHPSSAEESWCAERRRAADKSIVRRR